MTLPPRLPRKAKGPTAMERWHMDRVAQLPCLVSGRRPVTLHHVTGYADRMGRFTRSHKLVVPLAAEFHLIQHGPHYSVEALGHRGFYLTHGIDLFAAGNALWDESVELYGVRKERQRND